MNPVLLFLIFHPLHCHVLTLSHLWLLPDFFPHVHWLPLSVKKSADRAIISAQTPPTWLHFHGWLRYSCLWTAAGTQNCMPAEMGTHFSNWLLLALCLLVILRAKLASTHPPLPRQLCHPMQERKLSHSLNWVDASFKSTWPTLMFSEEKNMHIKCSDASWLWENVWCRRKRAKKV